MAIKLNSVSLDQTNGKTVESVVGELAKAHCRSVCSGVAALTDSSGGTGGSSLLAVSTDLTNSANSGTSLAQKASTEAALGTVKDALLELFTKANEYATKLGLDNVTYTGGGTTADGTVSAITVSVTAATTGGAATATNAVFDEINQYFYVLSVLTNKLLRAQGYSELTTSDITDTWTASLGALSVDVGTATDPAITKAEVDAELVKMRTNVATIATKLNSLNDGLGNALVVVV
jgi:hypothetical protein